MITTTLNRIRAKKPDQEDWDQEGWEKLLNHLGKTKADDEPLPFSLILEINGLDDALWCCRAEPQYEREWRLFAVACARRVEHLNPDPRVKNAIDVAERYANGEATAEELNTAKDAARNAAEYAANTAEYAARDAAWVARVAAYYAAANTAEYAAWDAARVTTWNAAAAVRYDARDTEREWQKQEFLRVVTETEQKETK